MVYSHVLLGSARAPACQVIAVRMCRTRGRRCTLLLVNFCTKYQSSYDRRSSAHVPVADHGRADAGRRCTERPRKRMNDSRRRVEDVAAGRRCLLVRACLVPLRSIGKPS